MASKKYTKRRKTMKRRKHTKKHRGGNNNNNLNVNFANYANNANNNLNYNTLMKESYKGVITAGDFLKMVEKYVKLYGEDKSVVAEDNGKYRSIFGFDYDESKEVYTIEI
jgi:hypothetical protein